MMQAPAEVRLTCTLGVREDRVPCVRSTRGSSLGLVDAPAAGMYDVMHTAGMGYLRPGTST